MRVKKLTVRNFLGITEADIAPGKITIFSGKNGQGKSSLTKALQAIFQGAPLTMIHKGTERAELIADLEDIVVTRVLTHKTSSVTVTNKEGWPRPAPQTFLNTLFGKFSFNPLGFLLADRKDRVETIFKAMDITLTKAQIELDTGEELPLPESGPALKMLSDAHQVFYSRRTDVNRILKAKKAAAAEVRKKLPEEYTPLDGIDDLSNATANMISETEAEIAGLEAEKKAAAKAADSRVKLVDRIAKKEAVIAAGKMEIEAFVEPDVTGIRKKVEDLRLLLVKAEEELNVAVRQIREITDIRTTVIDCEKTVAADKETLEALPGTFDDSRLSTAETSLAGYQGQQKDIEDEKARQRVWKEFQSLEAQAAEAETSSEKLSALVERFRDELPARALAEAKLPIAGLAIVGYDVLVDGKPIDDLSTAEQIRVTLDIARSLSKELPLICIDGVERLDADSFAEFTRQAESDGFQYFITRVGEPREGEIEVSGGKVATA